MKIKKLRTMSLVALSLMLSAGVTINKIPTFGIEAVYAQSSETQGIISRIESLPPIEDIKESHVNEVNGLMKAYADLAMNERLYVENYPKLKESYDKLVRDGFITNEMQSEIEEKQNRADKQDQKEESGKTATKKTEYTFSIAKDEQVTIMMRYTTDINDDGAVDAPDRITMTSPSGQTYPVSNASVMMKDDNITNSLTWTDNYLQMDIGAAEEGKWTIQTSVPVTFSQESYQGAAVAIKPENGKTSDLADRGVVYDSEGNPINPPEKEDEKEQEGKRSFGKGEGEGEKEEKSGGGSGLMIFGIILVVGLIAGLFVFIKKVGGKGGGNTKAPDREDDLIEAPKPLTDEEVMAQLKMEYDQKKQREAEMNEANEDMARNRNMYVPKKKNKNPYMDDINDMDDEEMDEYLQEYREGDTGLLSSEDKDEYFGEEEEDSSFFDSL